MISSKEHDDREPAHRYLLTRQDEVALAKRIESGGSGAAAARRAFVLSNQGLVITMAKRYSDKRLSLADLVQEGNLGLLRAIDKFDYRLGYRFSTYAAWWIRQSITRAMADKNRAIRLPVHVVDAKRKIEKVKNQHRNQLGEAGEPERLADQLGMPISKVERLLAVTPDPISLDAPVKGQSDLSLAEMVIDPNTLSPHDALLLKERSMKTRMALARLSEKERKMIRLRFGIGTRRSHTLEEIGEKFGVTRERVRQIETKALEKLRKSKETAILESLLDS